MKGGCPQRVGVHGGFVTMNSRCPWRVSVNGGWTSIEGGRSQRVGVHGEGVANRSCACWELSFSRASRVRKTRHSFVEHYVFPDLRSD